MGLYSAKYFSKGNKFYYTWVFFSTWLSRLSFSAPNIILLPFEGVFPVLFNWLILFQMLWELCEICFEIDYHLQE